MTSCFSRKIQKALQDASASNRVVTKSVLKEVTHRIQNTMQALTVFEKRFQKQQDTIQTM